MCRKELGEERTNSKMWGVREEVREGRGSQQEKYKVEGKSECLIEVM